MCVDAHVDHLSTSHDVLNDCVYGMVKRVLVVIVCSSVLAMVVVFFFFLFLPDDSMIDDALAELCHL